MTRPLTVVLRFGDFVIAVEDHPTTYFDERVHNPDRYNGEYEVEPQGSWHDTPGVECRLDNSAATGRAYCGHGYWYDSNFWRGSLA